MILELCNLTGLKLFTGERNKKERLFCIGSNLINFYFLQGEILERNMFVHLLDPNISIFCKCCFFLSLTICTTMVFDLSNPYLTSIFLGGGGWGFRAALNVK